MVFIPRNFKRWRGGNGSIERQIVTLTNDQIKALPTTTLEVVSAPASGYRIAVQSVTLRLDNVAGVYTNINATYAAVALQTTLGSWLTTTIVNDVSLTPDATGVTNFFNLSTDCLVTLTPVHDALTGTGSQWIVPTVHYVPYMDGQAVHLFFDNNGSGNLTGGNAANSLKVTTYYAIEEL